MSDQLFENALGGASSDESAPAESTTETVETAPVEITETTDLQTTEPTETDSTQEPESLTDEEKELKELKEYAENPNTPKFAREQIQRAIKFNESLKSTYAEKETALATELESLKSNKVYEEQDLQRYQQAEDKLNKLSSIASTPEDVLSVLQEVNPRLVPQVQQKLIWDALEKPDGSPDLNNLQNLVDRFTGYDGNGNRVRAEDALRVMNALRDGVVDPLDLDDLSPEERTRVERARAIERQTEEGRERLAKEESAIEQRVRSEFINREVSNWTGQVRQNTYSMLDKFKLSPNDNDPTEAKEFKEDLQQTLINVIAQTENNSPNFAEIKKAINLLSTPDAQRRLSSTEVENEIRQYFSNPLVQSKLQSGLNDINKAVEKTVLRETRRYSLMMKGLEVTNKEKVSNARPIPKSSTENQTPPQYTADQIAKMSAAEREEATMLGLTELLRSQKFGARSV